MTLPGLVGYILVWLAGAGLTRMAGGLPDALLWGGFLAVMLGAGLVQAARTESFPKSLGAIFLSLVAGLGAMGGSPALLGTPNLMATSGTVGSLLAAALTTPRTSLGALLAIWLLSLALAYAELSIHQFTWPPLICLAVVVPVLTLLPSVLRGILGGKGG